MANNTQASQLSPLSQTDSPPWAVWLFVWGSWALIFGAALCYVWKFGLNVPFSEDWPLAENASNLGGWSWENLHRLWEHQLWLPNNEHRTPLPQLVIIALDNASGFDFRAPMFFQVLVLGALAAVLVVVAQRLRGHPGYADAFFPLVLLNWGHGEAFLWGICVYYVLPVAIQVILFLFVIIYGTRLPLWAAWAFSFCLCLLPLCGAYGLAFVPGLTVWLAYCGVCKWRSPDRHRLRDSFLMLALSLPPVVLTALYFKGLTRPEIQTYSSNLVQVARSTLEFMTLGFGPAVAPFWPVSGCLMALLLGLSVAVLFTAVVREFRSQPAWAQTQDGQDSGQVVSAPSPGPRGRALGLLVFLGASGCLALGMGYGRPGQILDIARYAVLGAPLLVGLFFVWVTAAPSAWNKLGQMTLFSVACVMLSLNDFDGLQHGKVRRAQAQAFLDDLLAGVPVHQLVIRHAGTVYPIQKRFPEALRGMHQNQVSYFKWLQEDPPFQQVPLAPFPAEVQDATFDQGTWSGAGADSSLTFTLAKRTLVYGIRLSYTFTNPTQQAAHFQVAWRRSDQPDFPENQCYEDWAFETAPEGAEATFWMAQEMDQFRFRPDTASWNLKLTGIFLVVAADEPTDAAASHASPQDLWVLAAKGFYPWETWEHEGRGRWCQPRGEFYLVNSSDHPRDGRLELCCFGPQGRLALDAPLVTARLAIDPAPHTWAQRLTIPPGVHPVRFTCDARQAAPNDPRALSFWMKSLTLTKLAPTKD